MLKFTLPYSEFVVLEFLIDDYKHFTQENKIQDQNLIKFGISNVIEELSMKLGKGYSIESFNGCGMLLILNIDEQYYNDNNIYDLAYKTKEFFKKHFNITMTIGIGNTYKKIINIRKSYLEAHDAANYRILRGKDQIIFYKDINKNVHIKFKYPFEYEVKLINIIKQGKEEKVTVVVREMLDTIKEQSVSIEAVQYIYLNFMNIIAKAITQMNIKLEDIFEHNIYELDYETLEDIEHNIIDLSKKACIYINSQKESKNFQLRDQLIYYVKQCYMNPNLSLKSIANKFKLSSSYITRFFKDQTGYPLMRYIDKLRMDEAKKILINTDLTLNKILQRVGYIDKNNFIRKFKRNEGITPMQYRNNYKKN